MSTPRRIAGNIAFLTFAQFFGKAIGFVVVAYLARTLGAASFGRLSFAQAVGVYFQMLMNLGLDTFGAREVARHPEARQRYVDNILSIRAVASVAAFLLLAALAAVLPKDSETRRLLLYTGLSIPLLGFSLEWFFQGVERMHVVAISRALLPLLHGLLIFILVSGSDDVLLVPLTRFAAVAVATLYPVAVLVRRYGRPSLRVDLPVWRDILAESVPIAVSFIMITIYYNADTVILGFLKSDEMVGWYNAAYKCIFVVLLPAEAIRTALFPSLSRIQDPRAVKKAATAFLRTMCIVGIPIGFGGTIVAPSLIALIYGPGYANATLPLQILMWSVVMVFVNESYGAPLLAWGKQLRYTRAVTLSAAANLVFNFLLIPPFGMVGAAVATILAEVTAFVGVYPEFQKTVALPLARYAARPVAASAVMSVALLASTRATGNVFVLLAIGIATYFAVLLAIGGVRKGDLRLLLLRENEAGGSRPS